MAPMACYGAQLKRNRDRRSSVGTPDNENSRAGSQQSPVRQEELVDIDARAAAHHLIPTLRAAYASRADKRERYLELIGFILFLSLYFLTLKLQSSPALDYAVREGIMSALGPQEDNGEPRKMFVSHQEVYDWVRQVTEAIFTPMKCGNAYCDKPEEFPAFSHHGCQADCGMMNATPYTIVLEPRFTGADAVIHEALQTVTYNLCTDDAVPVCWWEDFQSFRKNFVRHQHDGIGLPDAQWSLVVHNLVPSNGLVVGGIFLDSTSSDSENVTTPEGDVGRRLKQAKRPRAASFRTQRHSMLPGWHPSLLSVPHGAELPFSAEAFRGRSLLEDGGSTNSSEGTSGANVSDGDGGSQSVSAANLSDSGTGIQSEWSLWQDRTVASMLDVEVRSAEYCMDALRTLDERLVTQSLNCYTDATDPSKLYTYAYYCCPAYKALLEGNCWCTAAVLEDWSETSHAFIAHDVYFPAGVCHDYWPSEFAPLIRGPECPITPPKLQIEGLNPTACYWMNELFLGDFGENSHTYEQTEWLSECWSSTTDTFNLECCHYMETYVEYDCFCYNCEELSSLNVYFMHFIKRLADACGMTIPGYHLTCQYNVSWELPGCEGRSVAPSHIRNVADSFRASREWITEHAMWESSVSDSLLTLYGKDWTPSPTDYSSTFQICATVSESPPFDCAGYLDTFCRFAMTEVSLRPWGHADPEDHDICVTPSVDEFIDMLCDEYILERCGNEQIPHCTNDVGLFTYMEHVEVFRELYAPCRGADVCYQALENCAASLPAITSKLNDCIAEPNVSLAQGQNADKYYPSDLYLCSLARDWTYQAAEGATNTSCDVVLGDVRQLEKRFNTEAGAQHPRDLTFCRESAQQASCTNGSTLSYSYDDRLLQLPTTDQYHGCRMHADCPYEYFCGMMVTGSASETDSLCMPCFWCEGCHPDTTVSPEHWFLTPVEPTCGHCPCAEECAPGCSVSMTENQRCDEACFTKACNYDNHRCPYPATDGEEPADLLPCDDGNTQVVRTANTGAARHGVEAALAQGCCAPYTLTAVTDVSQTRAVQVAVGHFPGAERIPFGWENAASQDSFEYLRTVNNKNRVLGGVVMKTYRNSFTTCGDAMFSKFIGKCHEATASTELSSPYSADGIFQIGNQFHDAEIAKDQHLYYPDPADLNQYGVPYGFRVIHTQGAKGVHSEVAYPVVLDTNLDSQRAMELVDFLQACDYFDSQTTIFKLQLLTYKVQDEGFTQTIFTVRADTSGSFFLATELGGMRTRWHANMRDALRIMLQLSLLVFFLQQLCR
ncbi:TRP-like ion channel Pkd2 [Cymbomonas tetramitiformis]|uniref:TRP-like ion channel Pkd2 n=1 Tax=Cymbomonas tetramitiformis TaxID=36881 RepID=A0AAE0L1T3_9CHLO|nr:TRP-like ion channel Pkd2 [Cymbomonas tetramitiformis]